jgi:hypothetical protein
LLDIDELEAVLSFASIRGLSMPTLIYDTNYFPFGEGLSIYCTWDEITQIANGSADGNIWLEIFSEAPEPAILNMIRGSSWEIHRKAQRCIAHGVCLLVRGSLKSLVAMEHDPSNPWRTSSSGWMNGRWRQAYLFVQYWRGDTRQRDDGATPSA